MAVDFKKLPRHLHINLDNCWRFDTSSFIFIKVILICPLLIFLNTIQIETWNIRENKNMYLFAFLSALVELNVFVDISVDFMLVGHTGNQVDQGINHSH